MAYSVLLPRVFSIYFHPDDHARRALSAHLQQLNARPSFGLTRSSKDRKEYRIACKDWALEFFADTESSVPPGDVKIHSELNATLQPAITAPIPPSSSASPAQPAAWPQPKPANPPTASSPKSSMKTTQVLSSI